MIIRSMPPASAHLADNPVPAPPPMIGFPVATWARRRCKHSSRLKTFMVPPSHGLRSAMSWRFRVCAVVRQGGNNPPSLQGEESGRNHCRGCGEEVHLYCSVGDRSGESAQLPQAIECGAFMSMLIWILPVVVVLIGGAIAAIP